MEGCTIGKHHEDSQCHKLSYVSESRLKEINEFDDDSVFILELRTGLTNLTSICLHHEYVFLKKYSSNQRKCSDPFSTHSKPTLKRRKSKGMKVVKIFSDCHLFNIFYLFHCIQFFFLQIL